MATANEMGETTICWETV